MSTWTMPATIMPSACVNGSSDRNASACCTSSRPIVLISIRSSDAGASCMSTRPTIETTKPSSNFARRSSPSSTRQFPRNGSISATESTTTSTSYHRPIFGSSLNRGITVKLTGNCIESACSVRFLCTTSEQIQRLPAKFPTRQNRELFRRNREFARENRGI